MKKVPITDIINSWLNANARLEDKCKEEICEYDSDSAYKGYMLGFQDGVQSQIDEDEFVSDCIITKEDIINAFEDAEGLTNEEDWKLINSRDQYWFYVGAMWILKQLENK